MNKLKLLILLGILMPKIAYSATLSGDSSTIKVSAKTSINCTVAVWPLVYSKNHGSSNHADVKTSIVVRCTGSIAEPVRLRLEEGQYNIGHQRRMSCGNDHFLNYDLYADPGYTKPWQDVSDIFIGEQKYTLITLYGRAPKDQDMDNDFMTCRDDLKATVMIE